ncbi:MAG: rod shape-determining protein MreC [Puniceicoccales bacterium]|jgi:rod shape-determining protein MreC|nr:rod shape-determining protein MreC [Puniceicoccales bacterium]
MKIALRCLLLLIAAAILCKKSFNPKHFLQSIALPVEKVAARCVWSAEEFLFETQPRETLIRLCKELSNENAALRMQLRENFDLQNRLAALENLTQIGQRLPHKKIFVRVIGRDIAAWFESVTLNKGRAEGVREGAIVIADGGIVGKITEIFEHFSVATLASSPKFRLAVCSENCATPMIFTGNGHTYNRGPSGKWELKMLGTLKNIPLDAGSFLAKGSRIIGSALAANVPGGLAVGYAENIYPSGDGLFFSGDVVLPETLSDFCEAIIYVADDL